jgi:hypothetical protein
MFLLRRTNLSLLSIARSLPVASLLSVFLNVSIEFCIILTMWKWSMTMGTLGNTIWAASVRHPHIHADHIYSIIFECGEEFDDGMLVPVP